MTDEALRWELKERTAEVDTLRAEVAALTARLAAGQAAEVAQVAQAAQLAQAAQAAEWRAKAAEYDALMATKTMHALRIPRAVYGRILARRPQP